VTADTILQSDLLVVGSVLLIFFVLYLIAITIDHLSGD
jgi:hypothetical protein